MRIVTVVGVRGSGKTTVVEALVKEWTARGRTVGTVKTVFCPGFHMDRAGSNTYRHTRAGASLVTARAEGETAVLYPRRLKMSEVLAHYRGCDVVVVEGDYELPVTRIVTAHTEQDARERINPLTAAVSGRIAGQAREVDGVPVLHPVADIPALADLILKTAPETEDLAALDEGLRGPDLVLSRAFCASGCRGHGRKGEGVRVTVDGTPLDLTPAQAAQVRRWAAENPENI